MSADDGILDLALLADLSPARGGRKRGQPFAMTYQRDLDEGDLSELASPSPLATAPSSLKALRTTHHTVARLLAEGRKAVEVAAITGRSQSNISILQDDPAFQELLAYYASQKEVIYLDVHQRLAGLGTTALEVLQERLEDSPDTIRTKELVEIAEMALDRSVAPPRAGTKSAGGPSGNAGVNIQVQFVSHQEARSEPRLVEGVEVTLSAGNQN